MKQKVIARAAWGCLIVCVGVALLVTAASSNSGAMLHPTGNEISIQFFGLHFHRLASTTPWPKDVEVGNWRLLAAYVDWPNLEPSREKWDFKNLDLYVDLAERNHVNLLLPLVLTPAWASSRPSETSYYAPGNAAPPVNLEDWRTFVRTVATRYKGRIHAYEIWNEPNLKGFFSGTMPELAQLACTAEQTLKQVDPSIVVSSPPFTNSVSVNVFDQYLKAGGAKCADVIGYHFYVNPDPPEEMVPFIQQVEAVMEKNGVRNRMLWDTETGWAVQNTQSEVKPAAGTGFNSVVLSPEQAAAYMARAHLLTWAAGVSRLYWYAWDDGVMGMTEKDGKTPKAPVRAYAGLKNWLVGARMISCASDSNGTWTSEITRDGGYHGWILWNADHSFEFRVPADWHIQSVRELLGGAKKLSPDRKIQIDQTPVLLENTVR